MLGVPSLLFGIGYVVYWYAGPKARGEQALAGDVMLAAMPIILGVQLILQAIVLDIQGVPRAPLSPPLRRARHDVHEAKHAAHLPRADVRTR